MARRRIGVGKVRRRERDRARRKSSWKAFHAAVEQDRNALQERVFALERQLRGSQAALNQPTVFLHGRRVRISTLLDHDLVACIHDIELFCQDARTEMRGDDGERVMVRPPFPQPVYDYLLREAYKRKLVVREALHTLTPGDAVDETNRKASAD